MTRFGKHNAAKHSEQVVPMRDHYGGAVLDKLDGKSKYREAQAAPAVRAKYIATSTADETRARAVNTAHCKTTRHSL
jgi:hypothetical protein